jgi:hypothetical protein
VTEEFREKVFCLSIAKNEAPANRLGLRELFRDIRKDMRYLCLSYALGFV